MAECATTIPYHAIRHLIQNQGAADPFLCTVEFNGLPLKLAFNCPRYKRELTLTVVRSLPEHWSTLQATMRVAVKAPDGATVGPTQVDVDWKAGEIKPSVQPTIALAGWNERALETTVDVEGNVHVSVTLLQWTRTIAPTVALQCLFDQVCDNHYLNRNTQTFNAVLGENQHLRAEQAQCKEHIVQALACIENLTRERDEARLQLQHLQQQQQQQVASSSLPIAKRVRDEAVAVAAAQEAPPAAISSFTRWKTSTQELAIDQLRGDELQELQQVMIEVQLKALQAIKDLNSCVVCMEDIKEKYMMVPCGHTRLCHTCDAGLMQRICPLCNTPITAVQRCY